MIRTRIIQSLSEKKNCSEMLSAIVLSNLHEFKGVTLWKEDNIVNAALFIVRMVFFGIGNKEGGNYSNSNTFQHTLALMVCSRTLLERIFSLLHE